MTARIAQTILISFFLISCQSSKDGDLPSISLDDILQAQEIEQMMQDEINKGEITEALLNEGELHEQGVLFRGLLKRLIKAIMPKHLLRFDPEHVGLTEEQQAFAEYKGIYGRCYQFRVYYPYMDTRVQGVKWASSILSIPRKDRNNLQGGVVLAPTLDGFTPLVESGLWLKLCRKGVATLMPESLYRDGEKGWEKLHFDPTPQYKSVDEFGLYEKSIRRYEKVLTMNVDLLRQLGSVKTDRGKNFDALNVMKVQPQRVGFWGSSFGAVVGSMVVAKDSGIKAAVLSVGGGNIPHIVSNSKVRLFKSTRRKQMAKLGLKNNAEYEEFISQFIESDPLDFAKPSDAGRLYMILAKKDRSVPTLAQYQLWEGFGRPENGKIRSGHVVTLLLTSWFNFRQSRRAVDSLIEKLSQQPLD